MSPEFEQLVAQFEQFQSKMKRVDDRFANIADMQGELSRLEAVATSPDRSVTVVAGPGGSVKDIRLTDAALKQRPDALAQALMSTLHEAVAESARKQAGIVDTHMGDDLQLTEQVLETQAEVLGTSVEDLRARMADAAPAPRPVTEERQDDYSERSFLRPADPEQNPPSPPASPSGSAGDDFLKKLFDEDDR
ncbi:YbaB/EbfC family nucleoid-associated protein [Amycolatopsis cihanbeyliensis]|uniref:DNA-binding protein YbaB n=1 Tax=Amycolatopsis cihanbeyliensis TaxID=1128664 RepID=A0A542DJL1_AMYCI|nr:YbaB/EbfC family nucleoid-associated protein [Amycolatopsis cihanbeyliensis]TQJ03194.1 DNA-binding protein YbaB [Amycolatopsis cihanbeyliensis]